MRVKLHGAYLPHELLDAMDAIVQTLVQNGADEFRASNLYFQPYREGRQLNFDDQDTGAPFRLLEFNGEWKSKAFKICSPRLRPGSEETPSA